MDKVLLLKEKTKIFKDLLLAHLDNQDVQLWFDTLSDLFADIESGKVVPPTYFKYGMALGKEHPFEEPGSIYAHPYSEFMAALEDWRSQPWFAAVFPEEVTGKPPFTDEK